jgi:hypothetical protein
VTILKSVPTLTTPAFIRSLKPRTRSLLGLWLLFFVLVAFGIHGSSIGFAAKWWSPEKPYSGYLLNTLKGSTNADPDVFNSLLMTNSREIRWDELMVATPLALSQFSHNPRFPVVNTNIGNGQNVLISPHVPVWHIATLARPATWGYFFFGPQRGLAWYWWFQVFSCFTALYLLLEIILKGSSGLAAFGAFWFCASAYTVCWSLWPAHITFFPALACIAAYRLLSSTSRGVQVICAILLGLSIPGFFMFIYPPWQVSLGHVFLFIFVGLFVRDKLHISFRSMMRYRLLSVTAALVIAGIILTAFLVTCWPDLRAMADSAYPGNRVSVGGDYSFAKLFKGLYNISTIYSVQPALGNECEAASFYYLFPAVFLAACLSKRLRLALGTTGWLLVAYLAGMLFFSLVGVSERVAKLTFLSYVPPYRGDIAIGLASIILCVYVLASVKDRNAEARGRWHQVMPWLISAAVVGFFIWHGMVLKKFIGSFPPTNAILAASLVAGFLSYCLLRGRSAVFCGVLGAVLVATTALFNPLATTINHIYDSELARQIVRFNESSDDSPIWICYGPVPQAVLVTVLGGRTISGVLWPPQLSLWRKLDPAEGAFEDRYNRYAEVTLSYQSDPRLAFFKNPTEGTLVVRVAPDHPALKAMGARYILAVGAVQNEIEADNFPLLYRSSNGSFSIYAIPENRRE